ncbi:enolase C-terminal domain-like protein [Mycolicibacterium sediminis]|uniref:O-succinylbenzoate synthase n=1 Tax=Mycolicibacterium sediminis TaxID=1286180 RepID=A0A7I7QV68_9MYCO|nr:enolase C-terminal domain-like protein [Mycolicibacterium sediminis]BBY30233.1 o-succinylbenzoate synthase [Mycolicibacterium sediminis]
MRTLIDFDAAPVFAIPVRHGAGGLTVREGVLLEGPQGWGEFAPWPGSTPGDLTRWLTAATEPGTVGWPEPLRGDVPVAATIPAVDPVLAARLAADSGCTVAEVAVGAGSIDDDVARVVAVRDALGPGGAVRCDGGGRWDVETAVRAIGALVAAVGELQYVQRPCRDLTAVADVRRRVDVRLAVPVAADGADRTALAEAADVAVLAAAPLGGVRRALRVAETIGLQCVVASSYGTTIGLSASLALAGSLPVLPYACALGTRLLLDGDVVGDARSLIPRDGRLPVAPMPPGPDPALVARYAATDPATVERWRRLVRSVLD